MAIPSENYGFLPQLSTFERGACAPTATANIMAAMAKTYPSLRTLINVDGGVTYQDIAATRNKPWGQLLLNVKRLDSSRQPSIDGD